MHQVSREDQFEYWLMDMDDAIEGFLQKMPSEIADKLDYSAESLSLLEAWLLEKYQNLAEAKAQSEAQILDGAARYIGETYRKILGGKWMFDTSDEKNVYYALPQLVGYRNQSTQTCPLKLVTASIARRTGKLIRTVLESHL